MALAMESSRSGHGAVAERAQPPAVLPPGVDPSMSERARLTVGPFQNPVRGLLHGSGAVLWLAFAAELAGRGGFQGRDALLLCAASQVALFATSALYHSLPWPPRAKARMQRADHAMIHVKIAGTLTALTWLAVVAGLAAKSPDGAGGFAYPLLFLPFLSSAFVPTGGMPGPVRWFAEHQPVTSIVDTIRRLYAEEPLGDDVWTALAWCVGLLVLAYALAMRSYRRRTSG